MAAPHYPQPCPEKSEFSTPYHNRYDGPPPPNYSQNGIAMSQQHVVVAAGVLCPSCKGYAYAEKTNVCALILVIIMTIYWFPIGLFCLFFLNKTKSKRCSSCGYTETSAKPIYIVFCISTVVWLAVLVALVVIKIKQQQEAEAAWNAFFRKEN